MKYFSRLPIVSYANSFARNIMTRVNLGPDISKFAQAFYPYSVKEYDRPDVLVFNYYDDPDDTWLIFHTNEVIDPYFVWRLKDGDFDSFILQKYGDISNANLSIVHYKNNWADDDQLISTAAYDAKTDAEKFYWTGVPGPNGGLSGYERKKEDVVFSTNKILEFTVTSSNGTFTADEYGSANGSTRGTVSFSNSSVISVRHIVGSFDTVPFTFTGALSGATAEVSAVTTVKQVIPEDLESYFSPVTSYEYEVDKNDSLKEIRLLDNRYKGQIEKKFSALLEE